MFEWICFIIGILCLGIAITFAVVSRHNIKKWTSVALFGVLTATFCFALPTFSRHWSDNAFIDGLYRTLSSLLYSLKVVAGRQDLAQIEAIAFTSGVKYVYIVICYTIFFISPIITTTWLMVFLGDMGEKIRYAFHFSKNGYIFSELNENALSIVQGIKKEDKHAAIVFCNTKNSDKSLIVKARKQGGICFYMPCDSFRAGWLHKCYNFYLVSNNEDKNIKDASSIIEKYKSRKENKRNTDKIIINAYAQSGTSIDIIESMNSKNVKVRFIDKVALLCNQLIFENPLYNIPNDGKNISVMIIGCGRTGAQMLKTVAWCGQMDGYTLKIRVYDKEEIKDKFFAQAPELKSDEYDIDFIKTDVSSSTFEAEAAKNLAATYVFIATGDDELNLQVAVTLRGIFRRKTRRYDNNPIILARVRDDFKTLNLKKNDFLLKRNIVPFGNDMDLFKGEIPFETKFEKLSLGVHLAYEGVLNADCKSVGYIEACDRFYCEEYNRRASMAVALHIAAKLVSCGIMKYFELDLTDVEAKAFEKDILPDKTRLDRLAKNEHKRWNAFYRSEGYRSATIEEMKEYVPIIGSHKDKRSKLHPCITEWDKLIELKEKYNSLRPNDKKDFQEYDYKIVKAIPEIIRFANRKK